MRLNIAALEQALSEIVNRHEVLRTRIIEIDGQPLQQIISPLTFTLPIIDLSHLPKDRAEAEVQRLSTDDARQPYNLAEAPLMRAKLLRLGRTRSRPHSQLSSYRMLMAHRLIIFYQELATLYEAFLDGKAFSFAFTSRSIRRLCRLAA